MQLRYDTEAINRDIPIKEVIERYAGINVNVRGNIACPAPDHTDSHPSAKIYEHSNTCHCFSCQSNFSPISLAKDYHPDLTFPDVCKLLVEDFGLSLERYSNIDEVRRVQNAAKRNEFADTFPLDADELKSIGLNAAYGGRAKSGYDNTNEGMLFPSLQEIWKSDKESVETMLIEKCNEVMDNIRLDIQKQNNISEKWNSYSENEKGEIQKTYEAVLKYQDAYLNGKIKLNDKQKQGLETMLESRNTENTISFYKSELHHIDELKEKIRSQQAERAKHSRSQAKSSQAKRHKQCYERD